MKDKKEILCEIAESIRQTGNDPYAQLYGYMTTGDMTYITRRNNARELIQTVKMDAVSQFIKELKKENI